MTNRVRRMLASLAGLGLGLWLTTTACAHGAYIGGPPVVDILETPVGPSVGRIVFRRIDADHVDWALDVSADDGATWVALWIMRMVRVPGGPRTHALWRDAHGSGQAGERGTRHDAEFTVLPGVTFGRIGELTSRADLESFGPGVAVRDTKVEIEEGFCTPGTRVYDGTPNAVDVAWQNEARTRVAFVRTSGERWATPRGVRVGATLRTLERTAGAPLTFAGFGWDHGGRLEWQEGRGSLILSLHIDRSRSDADDPSILGDVSLRSDLPAVRRLPITVGRLTMTWGEPYELRDCEQAAKEQPRR